ncbi:MAG: OmpH family outer membrane protein [Bacteroidota bacterium]|nr:OmpH family outer membrane protein [Bacteroidota bacterium]
MNKFVLTLNLVLLIALGTLYYLFFAYQKQDKHSIRQANAASANRYKIAYFELDSLQENYGYFKEMRDYLSKQEAQMTKHLNGLRDKYTDKLKEYNQKGPTMSQTEQGAFEQQLVSLKSDYDQNQQQMSQDMNNLYMQKMQDVKSRIQDVLKSYCRDSGYSYVFASSNEDYLYYKDTLRDITPGIVKLLNDEYSKKKK